MSDRGEAELDAHIFAVSPEDATGELRAIVGDDAVRHSEAADQPFDEFHRHACWNCARRLHFGPLGELVDGQEELTISPLRCWEWSQDVQPPDRERPGDRDGLEPQGRLMDLLGVELTGLHAWTMSTAS